MAKQNSGSLPPPWDKIIPFLTQLFVWGALFGVLFILRSFFLLIFLTFVFAYIQAHLVERLNVYLPSRNIRVVVVAVAILSVLIGIGSYLVPQVREQTELFVRQYPKYIHSFDKQLVNLSESYPMLNELSPNMDTLSKNPDNWSLKASPTVELVRQALGVDHLDDNGHEVREALKAVSNIGGFLLSLGSAFFLALLFSFLIVLDLPYLTRSVQGVKDTSLKFVYTEVADSLRDFAAVLGRALEAQLFIAILNTILTAIGIYLLGMKGNVAFLSMIVFLCSFIPVAGVFVSSFPICLIALQQSGVELMLLAVLLIIVIHMIETYILNPRIYGHHLHMNPVLVLAILTIGGKLFHIWGLILGVPICRYVFGHAIRRK